MFLKTSLVSQKPFFDLLLVLYLIVSDLNLGFGLRVVLCCPLVLLGDMAKGASKLHASPLVSLCKERKEFIKAAKYCRYDFVTSFVEYLESLLELGNALNHYVENELVICGDFSNSHHLSVSDFDPSEEDSFLESTTFDFEPDLSSICDHSHGEEEESIGLHDSTELQEECSTCKQHSEAYVDMNNMRDRGSSTLSSSSTHHHSNQENAHIKVDMSSEDHGHHEHNQRVPFDNKWETPQSGHWFPQHMNQESFGAPMYFSYHNDRFVHNGTQAFPMHVASSYEEAQKHQNNPANTSPTPPPPPPQVSAWDFLYPFSMNYDNFPSDHDHDVSEVRKREGIPD